MDAARYLAALAGSQVRVQAPLPPSRPSDANRPR